MAPKHSELYVATMRAMASRDVEAMRELLPAIQRLRCAASGSDALSSTQAPGAVPRAPSAPAPALLTSSEVASSEVAGSEVAGRDGLPPLLTLLAREPHPANAQMADMLLGAGEAADFPDGQPLRPAIMTGQTELVRTLLDHGADPNQSARSAGGRLTPLHAAVEAVKFHRDEAAAAEICGMLLAHGADAMAGAGVAGMTPLHFAAMCAQLAVVNALLAHGPAARMLVATDSDGLTALHYALGTDRSETRSDPTPAQRAAMVQALLQAGAPVHAATHDAGMTALHVACAYGFPECVPLLLAAGADPLRSAAENTLPVHAASASAAPGAWRALEPLVAAGGKSMLSTSSAGGPPLHAAVMQGTMEAARELLRLGAHVNLMGSSSRGTALFCAYGRGGLVQDMADWMDAKLAGRQVETYPPEDEVLPFVELLLAHGADPNMRAKERGMPAEAIKYATPLMMAVHAGHARVVAALLAAGADPKHSAMAGVQLLHDAVAQGHLAVVEVLLPSLQLADINDASRHGGSPLHIACQERSLECVRLLLAAGADPRVTWQGCTPSDLLAAQARGALKPTDRRRTEVMLNALRRAKEKLQQQQRGRPHAAAGAAMPPGPAVPLPATQVSAATPPAATIAPAVKACCNCGVLEGACRAQAGAQGTGMGVGGASSSQTGVGPPAALSAAQALPVELKRCAACARHLYCSAACQRAHWRAGHKEECAAIVASEASMLERFTGLQQQQQQAPR